MGAGRCVCVCGGVGVKPKRKPCTCCLSAGPSCSSQWCCSRQLCNSWELGSERFPEQNWSPSPSSSFSEREWAEAVVQIRQWLAERSGVEERGCPCTTGFLLRNDNIKFYIVQFSGIYVPCKQARKQEGASSVSQGGNADTGFLNTTIHRVRGRHCRKFWSALEEEALAERSVELSAVTFPNFLEHHNVICHFTTHLASSKSI